MAWRVMIEKNTSTRVSHEPEVGVNDSVTRGATEASEASAIGH